MSNPAQRVPPPTRLPGLITTPLSWLYSIGINHKNRRYDAGQGVARLNRPVISVGNLSTGGTGKTPMVHLVVRMLQELGHQPVIAMRGYGAKPGEKGDEQLEHEQAVAGVPIVAQPDRLAGLRSLFASVTGQSLDVVVLDDGFQHRKIARDLDMVLIDATRPPDRDALLPRGHLREPLRSLGRADLVILTHTEQLDQEEIGELVRRVSVYAPAPVLTARHIWSGVTQYTRQEHGWSAELIPLDAMASKRVYAASAIGNPQAFLAMARQHGLKVVHHHQLGDHAAFSESQAQAWGNAQTQPDSPPLLMTRKDWVKAEKLGSWGDGVRVIVPELSVEIEDVERLRIAIQSVCLSA